MSAVEVSIWVAVLLFAGTIITGALTFVVNRRTSADSRSIGLINASQASLEAALEQANADITRLSNHVKKLRAEVNDALRHYEECEAERKVQAIEIAALRREKEQGR